MAINVNDTTYSGTYAPDMIMLEMFGMDTVEKGLVYPKGDIKKQHTIDRLDIDKVLTPRQVNPTDSGTNGFTIDGRIMIPQDVQVYKTFNPRDLEANQVAELLSTTILAREVPASLESQMMQALLNRSSESLEKCLWQGSKAFQGAYTEADDRFQIQFFDGFINLFVNDPLVNLSSVTPATITTSNIATILNDLLTRVTVVRKAMITDKNRFKKLKFIMSPTTGDIYGQFLTTTTTFKGNSLDSPFITKWRGFDVETVAGMPDNTIIFCNAQMSQNSNLWVGMNAQEDWQLEMKRLNNGNEQFYMLGKWKYCVQYGWSQEIFMFTTLTTADFLP